MPNNAHVITYNESLCSLYNEAADIGHPVSQIAEWYLDRWWREWAETSTVATETVVEYTNA